MLMTGLMLGGAAVAVLMGLSTKMTFDRLMRLDERCNSAFADIDALLKYRHDLLPGLMQTVRGYLAHERDLMDRAMMLQQQAMTLATTRVTATEQGRSETQGRRKTGGASTSSKRFEAEAAFGEVLQQVVACAQMQPSLQANAHFVGFRDALTETENRIVAARRFYNACVEEFNATCRGSAGVALRPVTRLSPRQPFSVGVERVVLDEAVQVSFA